MGLLIAFILSIALCFFCTRHIYRKQLQLQPKNKFKAYLYGGFVCVGLFLAINTFGVVYQVSGEEVASNAGSAFDGATPEKFTTLYNDDLGGIEASKGGNFSAIKITGHRENQGLVEFEVGHGIQGKSQLDENGLLKNITWNTKNTDDMSLLSIATVVEALSSDINRDQALQFLKQSLAGSKDGKVKVEMETKRVQYSLTRYSNDTPLMIYIEPKF